MLAEVPVIAGLRVRVSVCVSVFRCSESLPRDTSDSDIPKLPHCEFVCLVDACILRERYVLRNTNERLLNHVPSAHKKHSFHRKKIPLLATNRRYHMSHPPLQGFHKHTIQWTPVSKIVLKPSPLS